MPATNGPHIRQNRQKLGIKPGKFALELGVSRGHLHGIEAGTKPASWELLHTLARRFNVEVSTLIATDEQAVTEAAA